MLAGEHPATLARAWSELEQDGFTVVAEVGDADAAVETARECRPELCLLDMDLPGGGILAANRISLELPETRIVVMFAAAKHDRLQEEILSDADGYLPAEANGRVTLPGAVFDNQSLPPRSRMLYLPRLLRHYRRRRRSGLAIGTAWASARARMGDYC
jgi:DNA-binding NarL/FixJ family response regulator